MRELFSLLVAFSHDLATGFWLAIFFLGWYLGFSQALPFFKKSLLFSLILILLTGILRMMICRREEISEIKKRFLLLKHLFLIPLLVGGTLWVWLLKE